MPTNLQALSLLSPATNSKFFLPFLTIIGCSNPFFAIDLDNSFNFSSSNFFLV